ncbi:hypothetical protein SDRG_15289 [Saprolegnia diclina VS20]|uniref:Uncharacterized protein n=1 Tax=Saprolegnia diclina (strain VS20) TaxID=1156394 RepID=T0PX85_SAPDV|nr:hypothetical protein SDRG_15289 [Saprolegnia diclina VS20]EQC26866.1 hypothetical protein SDRG_15289 [Saprolegnia diclina VS20]|eukprot:XP_008619679.1 hypothetical protein SDRG_15289 [Saprolegnia diclina VS20]
MTGQRKVHRRTKAKGQRSCASTGKEPFEVAIQGLLIWAVSSRKSPTPFNDAVAKLTAAARVHPAPFTVCGVRLTVPKLSYAHLRLGDEVIARALVQSGVYDVVLAEHDRMTNHFCRNAGFEPTIKRFHELPGAPLPDVIANRVRDLSVETFLFDKGDPRQADFCGLQFSLVFWPKTARVLLFDLMTGVEILFDAVQRRSVDTRLGLPSTMALVDALLPRFGDARESERATLYAHSLALFCDALITLKQLDPVTRFLSRFLRGTSDDTTFSNIASFVSILIRDFGWEPLAKSLHTMLRRWATTLSGLRLCYRLVASLAGAAESPICDPISQPFAIELIVSLWSTIAILAQRLLCPSRHVGTSDAVAASRAVFQFSSFLELHVARPEHMRQRWLHNRLPDRVVATVASFLGPVPTLSMLEQMRLFEPVIDMASGVAAAIRLGLDCDANKGYIHTILDTYLAGDYDDYPAFDMQLVSSLLVVAAAGHRFDTVLDHLKRRRRLALAPSILAFAKLWPALASGDVGTQCSLVLLRAAGDVNDNVNSQGRQTPVLNTISALTYFAKFDRALLSRFTDSWLGALTLQQLQTTLGDVVIELHMQVPSESRLLHRLAQKHVDAVGRPLELTDYALRNLHAPNCCDRCVEFKAFLLAPLRITFALGDNSTCTTLLSIIDANPLQLRLQNTSSPRHDDNFRLEHSVLQRSGHVAFVSKVRQPGQVTPDVLRAHLAFARENAEQKQKTDRVAHIRDAMAAGMAADAASLWTAHN